MPLELPQNYSGEDIEKDYTKVLKKIWDLVIPENFPDVLKFDTEFAKWIEHKKYVGPYHMWDEKLYTQIKMDLNPKRFYETGWDGNTPATQEDFNKAYPPEFFSKIRETMRELAKYVGVNVSNLDIKDNFIPTVNFD